MKILKKQVLTVISLVLMLIMTAFMAIAPSANAAVQEWNTYFHVMLAPNPVGVGQKVLVTLQMDRTNPAATIRANNWQGFKCVITKPDGTTETKGPYEAYSTASMWFDYTPAQVGTYTFEGSWPGQWYNTTTIQRWYKPSSAKTNLTVQQEPIPSYPDVSLPTDYWTRPIYGENKGWYTIADDWLMMGYDKDSLPVRRFSVFAPYTSAPNSAHILWTKPIQFGGIVGGRFGDKIYYTGSAYELHYSPLILNGRIIYTEHNPTSATVTGTRCLDLYTGEEIWYLNNTNIQFAQTLDIETANEHGVLPYLWEISGANWYMLDAFTGRMILNLTGMPTAGERVIGPNGEILIYVLSGTSNTLTMWNSTRAIMGQLFDTWSPSGTINASRPMSTNSAVQAQMQAQSHSPYYGVEWNVTLPDVPGSQSLSLLGNGYILATYTDSSVYPTIYEEMAYDIGSIARDTASGAYPTTLNHLWIKNRTDYYGERRLNVREPRNSISDGVYITLDAGPLIFYGYDIETGKLLWVTDPLPSGWAVFTYIFPIAYGKFYVAGYDGHIRAYNITTGKLAWDYYMGSSGLENAYGTYPVFNGILIADGKIYASNDEHSADPIPWRGGKLRCIEAETGQDVWNISGWMKIPAISDGIATAVNNLDMKIYTFGKGPSKTTVSAPQTEITLGQKIMITGAVTDQTSGPYCKTKDTPCVSDDSMASWMEYIYMQKPFPTNATGVAVTLDVIDANGNYRNMGTATTDISGSFSYWWEPDISGKYTIIATFPGTNSYGNSYAETFIGVVETPPATPPPQYPVPIDYTLPIVGTGIVLLIAIAIVGILMLRKR